MLCQCTLGAANDDAIFTTHTGSRPVKYMTILNTYTYVYTK